MFISGVALRRIMAQNTRLGWRLLFSSANCKQDKFISSEHLGELGADPNVSKTTAVGARRQITGVGSPRRRLPESRQITRVPDGVTIRKRRCRTSTVGAGRSKDHPRSENVHWAGRAIGSGFMSKEYLNLWRRFGVGLGVASVFVGLVVLVGHQFSAEPMNVNGEVVFEDNFERTELGASISSRKTRSWSPSK